MARRSASFESLSQNQLEELEADIIRGDLSWRALAKKFSVPEATLRSFAEKHGIVRNPTGLKRQRVEQLMAKPDPLPDQQSAQNSAQKTNNSTQRAESTPKDDIEAAAQEDARDMRFGLQAARLALNIVGAKLNQARNNNLFGPKEIKTLSETITINISTIRQIRGLDVVTTDVKNLTDDQLDALAKGRPIK
jgi:hypothetical protein